MKKIGIVFVGVLAVFLFCSAVMAEQNERATVTQVKNKTSANILVLTMSFDALGKIGDIKARDTLIKGLKSNEFLIKAYAIQALGRLGDKEAIPLLRNLLNDKNYLVKIMATKSLFKLGDSGTEDVLLKFLEDKDETVRAVTVAQLGEFGEKFFPKLFELISSGKDPVIRAKALEQLQLDPMPLNLTSLSEDDPRLITIRKAIEDDNDQIRQAGCLTAGFFQDKKAIPLLIERLGDKSVFVRAAAKEALGKLGERSLLKVFWKDLNEKDEVLRTSSFIALAYLKDVGIVSVLLKEIVEPKNSTLVKKEATRALSILKPQVAKLVNESLVFAKLNDVLSLENLTVDYKIRDKSLISIFIAALKNLQDPLHSDAPFVLQELNDEVALPALREALYLDDPEMVATTAHVLGALQDKKAVDDLIQACKRYIK